MSKIELEHYNEECHHCNKLVDMIYITHKIIEYDSGGWAQTKHEITLRQCSSCKMIQQEED